MCYLLQFNKMIVLIEKKKKINNSVINKIGITFINNLYKYIIFCSFYDSPGVTNMSKLFFYCSFRIFFQPLLPYLK